jgi:probable rRNA maturation factor
MSAVLNSDPDRAATAGLDMTAADLDVVVESPAWHVTGIDLDALSLSALAAVCAETGVDLARPLAIVFADDAMLRALNARHRGKDKPTNVLSFPPAQLPIADPRAAAPLGDVVLAFETIAEEAEAAGVTLRSRLSHMIVHGCLHLCGYDHEEDADAQAMEAFERRALARLGVADPYETRDHG